MSSVHEVTHNFKTQPNMLTAALWYARQGFFVLPLHNAIFDDDGHCTGCTCEEYRRSNACKRDHPYLYLGPDGKCDQPGKCPRIKWHAKSSIDVEQIKQWWKWWPQANIGIDAGKSGLLILDADLYKATYDGDSLQLDDATVASRTGGGGLHQWYRQPAGKAYGNATGELPAGIDIRGHGGYIVAPPSLHNSGRRYAFIEGRSPANLGPLPLPPALVAILEAAQGRAAMGVKFAGDAADAPDLSRWWLHDDVLDLIHNGAAKGERSEADYRVILALARAGASDDDIRAVFTHYEIGEKYRERGDKYLAHSIGKARAWLEDHPPDPTTTVEQLQAARQWVRSPACLAKLRAVRIPRETPNKKGEMYDSLRRVAELVPLLDALIEMLLPRRTTRLVTTVRDLADRCAMSKSSAARRLMKLADAELLTTEANQYGTLIDLSSLVDLSGTIAPTVESVPLRSTSDEDFFADHRADDVFVTYPYTYAILRRQMPTVLMQSLGASGLLLWEALLDGGTVKDLAEASGLTVPSVRATLKRYDASGLLLIWEEGRAKVYELHPNAWDRIEERREHMVTAGIGQLRAARNASEKASYAQRKLQSRMPLEPREKAKLTSRRDKADDMAAAYYDSLLTMGVNPYTKVRRRPHDRVDKQAAHLDRLRFAQRVGDRVEQRPKRNGYKPKRPNVSIFAADAEWGAGFNDWAMMTYGPGWWVRRDINGILAAYENYLADQERQPTIHWDEDRLPAAIAPQVAFEFEVAA